ncbi:MAG: hypothetical protein WKF90_04400 [Pyrinomonadaceae bacterium]
MKKNLLLGTGLLLSAAIGVMAYTVPFKILNVIPAIEILFPRTQQDAAKLMDQSAEGRVTKTASMSDSSQESPKIPLQISYLFLFKRIENVEKLATEEEAKGKDGKIYRQHYKNKAKITDEQNAALSKTAKDCLVEVSKKDAEAKKIIDKEHAKHPGGRINPGEPMPTPPIELTTLKQKRDAIILRYIDVLKESFSSTDFIKFQQFVDQYITAQVSTATLTKDLRPVFSNRESIKQTLPDPAINPHTVQSEDQK